MTSLVNLKQQIINFIGKNEAYIKPVAKLLLAIITFAVINGKMGYMSKIDNMSIVLIAALICSFMPSGFIVLVSAVFIVLHMYALSLETAIIVLVLFVVLFLFYFRLSPNDTLSVIFTPILNMMGIPYVVPVSMGLVSGPAAGVSAGCGVIVYGVLHTINRNADGLRALDSGDMATRLKFIIDAIMDNKGMILLMVAFIITALAAYIVSQLPIDYSWPIAVVGASLFDAIIILVGNATLDAGISAFGVIFGTILAMIVGMVVVFFKHDLNYNRTEKVQFEDDDYYYYVKAIPKRSSSLRKAKKKRPAPTDEE